MEICSDMAVLKKDRDPLKGDHWLLVGGVSGYPPFYHPHKVLPYLARISLK